MTLILKDLFLDHFHDVGLFSETGKSRPILSAVHVEIGDDYIEFQATDSYCLARTRISLPEANDTEPASFMLNYKDTWKALKDFGSDQFFTIEAGEEKITVTCGDSMIVLPTVYGDFPRTDHFWEQYEALKAKAVEDESVPVGMFRLNPKMLAKWGRFRTNRKDELPIIFYGCEDPPSKPVMMELQGIEGMQMPVRKIV